MRTIGSLLLGLGLFALPTTPQAQLALSSTQPADAVSPDSIVRLTAEAQNLALVAPADLPEGGTYWVVTPETGSSGMVPWPCPPPNPNLPIYAITGTGNSFLVDATGGLADTNWLDGATVSLKTALEAQAQAVMKVISLAQGAQLQAATVNSTSTMLAMDSPEGESPMIMSVVDTNALYLEWGNVANGVANLNLHNATHAGGVYAIWSSTNLATPLAGWQVETEMFPTGNQTNVLPFTVATQNRDILLLKAEDWTDKDSNGDGVPDWWAWWYFGDISVAGTNLDYSTHHYAFSHDYSNSITPIVFDFLAVNTTNDLVNTSAVSVQLEVAGYPCYIATLVDGTNFANATWSNFASINVPVNLGLTEGWHDVWVGLRGHGDAVTNAVWHWQHIKLDYTPPQILVTNLPSLTVAVPMVQIQGLVNEELSRLTYDVSNADAVLTNLIGYTTEVFYDTNLLAFTTNSFQCYDIALTTNGANVISLHATDLAGNTTTTNFSVTVDYGTAATPTATLVWPPDGTPLDGDNFILQATVSDPTATVTVSIVDTNGQTNVVTGTVERNGQLLISQLPLANGANNVTVTTTGASGLSSSTNFIVTGHDVGLTIDPLASDQLNQSSVTVSGTIGDTNDTVTVNGEAASMDGNDWIAYNVPVSPTGTADLEVEVRDGSGNLLAKQKSVQYQPAQALLASFEWIDNFFGNGWWMEHGNYQAGMGGGDYGIASNGNWFYPYSTDEPISEYAGYIELAQSGADHSGPWTEYRHHRSKVVVTPGGPATPNGETKTYLVRALAMWGDGDFDELPLPPEWLQIQGQTLVNSGETNTNYLSDFYGSVWGETLVQAPAGVEADITPVATQVYDGIWYYWFDEEAKQVGVIKLESRDRLVHGVIQSMGGDIVNVTIKNESTGETAQIQDLGTYSDVFGNNPEGTPLHQTYDSEADILSDDEVTAMDNGTYAYGDQKVIFVRDASDPSLLHFYTLADNYGKLTVTIDATAGSLSYSTTNTLSLQQDNLGQFGNLITYLDERINSADLGAVEYPAPPAPIQQRSLLTKTLIGLFKSTVNPNLSLVRGTVEGFMGGAHSDYDGLVGVWNLVTSSAQRAAAFKALTTWNTYSQIPTAIANGLDNFMTTAEASGVTFQFGQSDFTDDLSIRAYVGGYAMGFTTEQLCVAAVGAGVVAKGAKIAEVVSKVTLGEKITTVAIDATKTLQAFKAKSVDFAINAAQKALRTEQLAKAAEAMADSVAKLSFDETRTVGQVINQYVDNLNVMAEELATIGKPLDDFGVKAHQQLAKLLDRDLGYYPGDNAARACVMACNKLEDGVRYEDFIKGFTKADGTVAKDQLKDSLDAYYDVTRNLAEGECPALPVKGIDQIHSTLYHYADAAALLDHAEGADGVWSLSENGNGRYITSESLNSQAVVKDRFQLPKKLENGAYVDDPTKGRFKCEFSSSQVADDCSVPQSYQHSVENAGPLDKLEPVCTDNPTCGNGGGIQYVEKPALNNVTITDLKSGQVVQDKNHLNQLLNDYP